MPDDRVAQLIAAVLCVLSLGWAAAVISAARFRADATADSGAGSVAAVPYAIGRLICHQRRDRSFTTGGVQWPVCGRCSGLYVSAAIGVLAIAVTRGALVSSPLAALRAWRIALVAAALPTLGSWLLERAALWAPTSVTRAAMAAPLGAAVGALIARLAIGEKRV